MEIVLYRKYRPKNFGEVLGQEHIIKVLESALKEGRVSHAYLFSGSRGTGKTSVARIFAREIGCTDNDMVEIDAASNRGIDDIRELREAVNMLPFESPYKVYIIDETHMLTPPAFNALLKTLEEPPKHAVFILATTELEKLPETIISRCETHTFKRPSQKILKDAVSAIAKKEGFTLETASADLIALLGEGSFRDATGILQKVISSSSDKKISIAEVELITGAPKRELINNFIFAIEESKIEYGLKAVQEAVENNVDMKVFLKLILHKIRSIMLLKYVPDMETVIKNQFGADDFEFLKKISASKNNKINSVALKILLDAYDEVSRAYILQLPLELALIKILKQDND